MAQIGVGGLTGSAGAVVVLGIVAHGVFAQRSSLFCPSVIHGRTDGVPGVSLTFDDGPHPDATPAILDELGALGARAAFFVIGRQVERWPDLVRRMDAEGHLVCNHTFTHSPMCGFSWRRAWEDQLRRADDAVERVIGQRPALFRPPMGIKTPHIKWAIRRTGHTVVTWSLRAFDGVPTTPGRILHRLVPRAAPGDILALHDGLTPPTRRIPKATVEAVRPLVTSLRERGLTIARLDELTGLRPYADPARAGGSLSFGPAAVPPRGPATVVTDSR